ncbi:unnamed protein product [Gadus morhua 'NCC']
MGAEDPSVTGGYRSAAEHRNTGGPGHSACSSCGSVARVPLPIMPLWDQKNGVPERCTCQPFWMCAVAGAEGAQPLPSLVAILLFWRGPGTAQAAGGAPDKSSGRTAQPTVPLESRSLLQPGTVTHDGVSGPGAYTATPPGSSGPRSRPCILLQERAPYRRSKAGRRQMSSPLPYPVDRWQH